MLLQTRGGRGPESKNEFVILHILWMTPLRWTFFFFLVLVRCSACTNGAERKEKKKSKNKKKSKKEEKTRKTSLNKGMKLIVY